MAVTAVQLLLALLCTIGANTRITAADFRNPLAAKSFEHVAQCVTESLFLGEYVEFLNATLSFSALR